MRQGVMRRAARTTAAACGMAGKNDGGTDDDRGHYGHGGRYGRDGHGHAAGRKNGKYNCLAKSSAPIKMGLFVKQRNAYQFMPVLRRVLRGASARNTVY